MSGFQKQVNITPAPAVEGDFASANPRTTVLGNAGGLVTGLPGVTVARFAWIGADGATVYNYGTATKAPDGFVHREQQGLITAYLAEVSMLVPQGFPITLHNNGDFWMKVGGSTAATPGAAVYADYSNGTCTIGSAATGASATGAIGATFTATGAGVNLTTSAVTGLISIGDVISGTGVPANTTIVSQTSGTAGGAGVYVTSVATTASAATVTAFGTVLNISAVGSGALKVGDPVSGTGVPAGAVIAAFGTGSGQTGTYVLNTAAAAYAASTAITVVAGVLTRFVARTSAAVGELVKISTWG